MLLSGSSYYKLYQSPGLVPVDLCLAIETNALALPPALEGRGCFFSTACTKQMLSNSTTTIL